MPNNTGTVRLHRVLRAPAERVYKIIADYRQHHPNILPLFDSGEIRTQLARRDGGMGESDVFEVVFDSYHDHQTAYSFTTNPSGTKRDAIVATVLLEAELAGSIDRYPGNLVARRLDAPA